VLSLGNDDTDNDGLLEDLDLLLQLGLDLVDKLRVTPESDFIRSGFSTFPWESDKTGLLERLGWATGVDDNVSQVASSLTDEGSVLRVS
jgi:hypothetical protein